MLRLRLQRLLHGPGSEPGRRQGRLTLAGGLLALFTLAGLPIAQAQMICTDHVEGRLARFECPSHMARLAAHVARPRPQRAQTTSA